MEDPVQTTEQEPQGAEAEAAARDWGTSKDDVSRLEAILADSPEDTGTVVEDVEEAEAPPGDEGVEKNDTDDEEAEAPADPKVEKARTALKREKILPESVLERMSEEEILAAGLAAKEREAERTREWQRQQDELRSKETAEDPKEPEAAEAAAGEPFGDLDELVQPLVEEFGEEAAKPVRQLAAMVQQMRDTMQSQQAQQVATAVDDARQQLGERFPGLSDDDVWSTKVEPELQDLAALPRWREAFAKNGQVAIRDMVQKAAQLADLERVDPKNDADESEAFRQESRRRLSGSSAGAGRRASPYSTWSDSRLETASLEAELADNTKASKAMYAEIQRRAAKKT